jgi:hypothetical protein
MTTTMGTPPAHTGAALTSVGLAELERDPEINCRAGGVSERVVADYVQAIKAGATFPPIVVFRDSAGKLWLADGFHRCRAAELEGGRELLAELHDGDRRDAQLYAAGANAAHGARRTRADVRRAVLTLLTDPEWRAWSDREVATRCAVSPTTVGKFRAQLSKLDSRSGRRGKDGKVRRVPKRKNGNRKTDCAGAVEVISRRLDGIVRGWPKGEPLGLLVEAAKAWIARLEGAS